MTSVRPIIFSAPMVRALLDGRKTMTRRVLRLPKKTHSGGQIASPYQVGDTLWVREALRRDYLPNILTGEPTKAEIAVYVADHEWVLNDAEFNMAWTWRNKSLPSIHMPRWASRLTLKVTATKIERLQCITDEDAIAEGIVGGWHGDTRAHFADCPVPVDNTVWGYTPVGAYRSLWNFLHGAASWGTNPEVVAISFEVIESNIDDVMKAAA